MNKVTYGVLYPLAILGICCGLVIFWNTICPRHNTFILNRCVAFMGGRFSWLAVCTRSRNSGFGCGCSYSNPSNIASPMSGKNSGINDKSYEFERKMADQQFALCNRLRRAFSARAWAIQNKSFYMWASLKTTLFFLLSVKNSVYRHALIIVLFAFLVWRGMIIYELQEWLVLFW